MRNCMAHYGLGQVMTETDIIHNDLMGGITQKLLGIDYEAAKRATYYELKRLADQIKAYLF